MVLTTVEWSPANDVHFVGFVDPSGGGADSMIFGIAHNGGEAAVLDLVREVRSPFSPESVVEEFASTLKMYRIGKIHGDRYAGEWPRERSRALGIDYEPSTRNRSDIYVKLLPLVNSRHVVLLDHPRMIGQLCALERRTARGGKDSIDHGTGGHDDVINAGAGAIVQAVSAAIGPHQGLFDHYREEAQRLKEREAPGVVWLKVPTGTSHVTTLSGQRFIPDGQAAVRVSISDAEPIVAAGFRP